jgi:selT/selW/selH-like putative selenoprotein
VIKQERNLDATLVRGGGGEFEVTLDGRLIFSKKAQGRFPEPDEVIGQLPA